MVAISLNVLLVAGLLALWWHDRRLATAKGDSAASSSMHMENGNTQMSASSTAGDPGPISAPENREAPLAPLQLTPQRMQSIGVRLGTVAMKKVDGEIRVTGNVDVNERQLANVQLRFPGWIHKVFVDATYDLVHKGQPHVHHLQS